MDSTKLFRTGHTADETFLLSPSRAVLDNSIISQPRIISQSRVIPTLSTPLIPVPSPRIFTQPIYPMPLQRPTPIYDDAVLVYCPVCRRDYYNYQAEQHARVHDSTFKYDFKIDQPKQLSQTADSASISGKQQVTPAKGTVKYPLIQPMEFWTNQLSDSAKDDVFIMRSNKNYDAVDRQYFNPPPIPEVIAPILPAIIDNVGPKRSYMEGGVQTHTRPPLQYESNDTNLYNFLDNAVNSKNGPKFSFADVVKNNKIITPKRQLDDWELMYKNQAIAPTKRTPTLAQY